MNGFSRKVGIQTVLSMPVVKKYARKEGVLSVAGLVCEKGKVEQPPGPLVP